MKLPLARPEYTAAPLVGAEEVFHSFSRAMCPRCHKLVDGARILRGGKVYLRKQCPSCGRSEALISGDADWFLKSLTYIKEGSVPLKFSTQVTRGCPEDCGLCEDHEQHSCLPIIEVTNHCNLECPICIVQNRHNYNMTPEEFGRVIDGLVEKEGTLETINLSGGEPTLHPEFFTLLDIASRAQISRVSISTNGLRCATDPDFCRELARRGTYVSLQLDALANPALRTLRGGGDHHAVKRRALANLEAAGVRTTIVSTVAKGINDDQVGECIKLLYERDFILSLMFQPAAFTGYGGAHFGPHDPSDVMTIPDVVAAAEAQSEGRLLRSDFLPLPCSHPSCFGLTYLLKVDDGFVPFPRFLDLDQYMDVISNRGTIRPDEGFEGAIRHAINDMWTSADQVPDSEKILRALKRSINVLYPPDRALALAERLRLGEALVKTVFIHAFMDEYTFEVDRIRKCCTHYALPDGRLMPGCAYNMLYRDKDPRFTGPVGETTIWGKQLVEQNALTRKA
ncbi:MAG: radical SAM protein [Deltaproteobacteria bacterium]|nr:radical SAM protein [Deltaproteobacteria bacterium]